MTTPTLIITNDFPPTIGGIEAFVAETCRSLDNQVVVLTRHTPGWRGHDQQLPFRVIRHGSMLLPTPAVGRLATQLIKQEQIRSVIFGAMAPLSLLTPVVRAAGADRVLAISHGHETWWASLPGSRRLLRRMAHEVDAVSVISDYTRSRIAPALAPVDRGKLVTLPPPVDQDQFRPAAAAPDSAQLRCIAVGRMVRQKGFDTLLRCWPAVLDQLRRVGRGPAELVLVGDGPQAPALRRAADRWGVAHSVRFTGALSRERVAEELRSSTVFALPVRTRLGGLNPEGLGLGFLEAASAGLPVVVGRSGGAPETVRDGVTGFVVQPDADGPLADRIAGLLADPERAAAMGRVGRSWVGQAYGTERFRARLAAVLASH